MVVATTLYSSELACYLNIHMMIAAVIQNKYEIMDDYECVEQAEFIFRSRAKKFRWSPLNSIMS